MYSSRHWFDHLVVTVFLYLSGSLTAAVGEKAVEGKGEGWGGGACGHSRGGVYTATGHDGGGGDMTCPQICTWTGRLICGRSGMEERRGKGEGRKKGKTEDKNKRKLYWYKEKDWNKANQKKQRKERLEGKQNGVAQLIQIYSDITIVQNTRETSSLEIQIIQKYKTEFPNTQFTAQPNERFDLHTHTQH